jgi:hypothetical protein
MTRVCGDFHPLSLYAFTTWYFGTAIPFPKALKRMTAEKRIAAAHVLDCVSAIEEVGHQP